MVSRRAGVVLVDVIVAAVMLGISLTAMISMTGRALTAQRSGQELQAAAMLADEQLHLVLARGPDNYSSRFGAEGVCEAPFEHYRYRLEFSSGEGGDPYRVVATIAWQGGRGEESVSVETMMAPRLGEEPDPDRRPEDTVERGY
jgi:Tfp pilus assembly protein PilV